MWNPQYRRGGIRFFPHIIPIGFPLIFPFGVGLLYGLFHALLPIIGLLLVVGAIFFIIRMITLGSPQSAWDSMRNTGNQWQQRFTSSQQQPPYYQPSTPQTPYYQPTQQPEQPQYGQGYQPSETTQQTPYYQPSQPTNEYYQPKANRQEEMPPAEQ